MDTKEELLRIIERNIRDDESIVFTHTILSYDEWFEQNKKK